MQIVIVEGIQGVGGIRIPTGEFLWEAREVCDHTGTLLILDEIQSGYGRSGKFFCLSVCGDRAGRDHYGERNGQRIPGSRSIDSQVDQGGEGDVGNHIRGNHLACAAGIAVLDVIKDEQLVENADRVGGYLMEQLKVLNGVIRSSGKGIDGWGGY